MVTSPRWLFYAVLATAWSAAIPLLSMAKLSIQQMQEFINVTGQIRSSTGEIMPGATIRYQNKEASADPDGQFKIRLEKPADIVFSAIGYMSDTLQINQDTVLTVVLYATASTLDEVVVVGYGVQRRSNVSGSLATVDGKTLSQRPVPNAANMLQGRIPGLQVTQPSGEPGRDNPSLLIRGRGTFGGNSAPLVLIDGVTGSLTTL